MKKLLVLLLTAACALCLAFAFVGCTGENGGESSSGTNTQQGETGGSDTDYSGSSDSGSDNTGNSDSGSDNTDDSGNTGDTGDTGGSEETGGGHVHNYGNLTPEKPATCTEEGLQAHYYCKDCQTYFDGDKNETTLDELKISVDSTAHNYGNLIPEKSATCTKEGLQAHYYCSGCQKYFDSEKSEKTLAELKISVDPNAHKWGEWIETEPTCEKQGGELRVCKLNNLHTELKNPIPALGHILEENQVLCKTCGVQLARRLNFELNSDNTYKLTSGTPTSGGKIMIPKIYNNLPVTSIGGIAFQGCESLESITIPDSVTSIGNWAFYGTSLKGVYITDIAAWCNIDFGNSSNNNPLTYAHNLYLNNQLVTELTAEMLQGVTTIKIWAFEGFGGTSITIPDSVTSIGYYAFYKCTSLTSVTIPNSVTSIGDWAFNGCTNLTSITVTDGNTTYSSQDGILYNKDKTELIKVPETKSNITVPDSVTSIGEDAFSGCTSLTSITIPNSVSSIGSSAFEGCTSLENITIPNSVSSIGSSAFEGCTSLENITLPFVGNGSDKTHLGYIFGAYYSNNNSSYVPTSLKTVIITGGNSIGEEAFSGCESLTSITIPDSVTSIGRYAFKGCISLTSVYITDIAAWCNIDFSSETVNPLSYAHNLYLNNQLVTELTAEMLQGVTTIKYCAFYECTSLTSITIPDSVTSIGNYAFMDCTNLKSVTIGNGVTFIGFGAFSGCTGLTSITIPERVTSIGGGAFSGCTSLTSITVAEGNTRYSSQDGVLYNKNKTELIKVPQTKTSITIPNSVTSIGYGAFSGCTSLTSVIFNNPDGWYYTSSSSATSGTDIKSEDLKNPQTAATYLKSTYKNYYWKRKTT